MPSVGGVLAWLGFRARTCQRNCGLVSESQVRIRIGGGGGGAWVCVCGDDGGVLS